MKNILIATKNKDKYKIAHYLLEKLCFPKLNNYQYFSLNDINYKGPEEKEEGTLIQRAEQKAKTVKNYLDKNNENRYEYIIGIDDGIFIKGKLQENIKDYVKKILYENYLNENENFSFSRAYCVISKDNKIFKTITNVPYKYKTKKNAEIKENTYPLSQVSCPIGMDKSLDELNIEEGCLYCFNYSKDNLIQLKKEIDIEHL